MAPLLTSKPTSFTLDNTGRFLCNMLQEATESAGLARGEQRGSPSPGSGTVGQAKSVPMGG
jgi:hypothetical protein